MAATNQGLKSSMRNQNLNSSGICHAAEKFPGRSTGQEGSCCSSSGGNTKTSYLLGIYRTLPSSKCSAGNTLSEMITIRMKLLEVF